MNKQDIINYLKLMKKQGYSYKLIAYNLNIKVSDLYAYIRNDRPAHQLTKKLEEYLCQNEKI